MSFAFQIGVAIVDTVGLAWPAGRELVEVIVVAGGAGRGGFSPAGGVTSRRPHRFKHLRIWVTLHACVVSAQIRFHPEFVLHPLRSV